MGKLFAAIVLLFAYLGSALPATPLAIPPLVLSPKTWNPPPVLDQYASPMCVGYATAAWLETGPHTVPNIPTPEDIYADAQAIDGNPPGHTGTDVWAALDTLEQAHYINNLDYSAVITDVLTYVAKTGPVIVWGPWFSGMYAPRNGRMTYTGTQSGLHAFLVYGLTRSPRGGWDMLVQNSYGSHWGIGGRARMNARDMQQFFDAAGGAAMADKIIWWNAFSALRV